MTIWVDELAGDLMELTYPKSKLVEQLHKLVCQTFVAPFTTIQSRRLETRMEKSLPNFHMIVLVPVMVPSKAPRLSLSVIVQVAVLPILRFDELGFEPPYSRFSSGRNPT